ncbi:hypothetical protein [Paracidovorax citrulli]
MKRTLSLVALLSLTAAMLSACIVVPNGHGHGHGKGHGGWHGHHHRR